MADDAAAPDGELTDASSEPSETSEAAESAEVTAAAEGSEAVDDANSADSDVEVVSAKDFEYEDTEDIGSEDVGSEDVGSEDIGSEDIGSEDVGSEDVEDDDGVVAVAPGKAGISHVRVALIAGIVLVLGLGGLSGWLGYRAYESVKAEDQRNLFVQVGRQGALNLTTIDWEHADEDVQRVLDSATGTFYDDFQQRSQPFIAVVKQAQSKSVGNVTEAGLESEQGDEGKVLVAVTVKTSNAGAPEQQPRAWRMRITVKKEGDDNAKVSNVEFVP